VLGDCLGIFVNAESNNSDFISPPLSVLLQHGLVVGHGCLAGRAPGGPEINKQNLTSFVADGCFLVFEDRDNFSHVLELTAHADLALDLDLNSFGFQVCHDELGLRVEFIYFSFVIR
jgi:hypothetical protein